MPDWRNKKETAVRFRSQAKGKKGIRLFPGLWLDTSFTYVSV